MKIARFFCTSLLLFSMQLMSFDSSYASMMYDALTNYVDFDVSMKLAESQQRIKNKNAHLVLQFFRKLYEKNNFKKVIVKDTVKIPKILHHIWFGSKLPQEYESYYKSWIDNHPDWTFIFWTDSPENYRKGSCVVNSFEELENILKGNTHQSIVVDVTNFALENRTFFDDAHNYAEKSDILRWEAVCRIGGTYVDTDFECLKPLDIFHHTYDFYTGVQPLDTNIVQLGAGLFGSAPNHPILKKTVETLKNDRDKLQIIIKTGPIHFTRAFCLTAGYGNEIDIALPASYFYPKGYEQRGQLQETYQQPESFAVHHWAGSWLTKSARKR